MIARQVDRLRIAAGAEPYELQAVARALAHDVTPIPNTPHVEVELVRLLAPPLESRAAASSTPRTDVFRAH
jgi:hypothetical protein